MLLETSDSLGCWPVRWITPSPPETDFKANAPHPDAPGHREAERFKKLGERRLRDTLVSSPTPSPVPMEQDSREGAGVQERLCLLTSVHMCSHLFMSAHICSCLFTSARVFHVCSHVLISVHVCSHLFMSAHICSFTSGLVLNTAPQGRPRGGRYL